MIEPTGDVVPGSRQETVIGREVELDLSRELSDTRLSPGQSARLRYTGRADRRDVRLRFRVIVEPDAFYTRFFEALLAQGAGRGDAHIREALAASRRSPFIVFQGVCRWRCERERPGHESPRMVCTPHRLASQAGLAVLHDGGTALDAAVAAAATIAVVYPHMNGIGGDSFWLIYDAAHGRLAGLSAAGRSAAAVDPERYRARFGASIPPRGGPAALTVPGTVAGWWSAHLYSRDCLGSTIAWPALLDHAIAHARDGFDVSDGQRRVTALAASLFADGVADEVRRSLWPIFHPDRLTSGRFTPPTPATLALIAGGGATNSIAATSAGVSRPPRRRSAARYARTTSRSTARSGSSRADGVPWCEAAILPPPTRDSRRSPSLASSTARLARLDDTRTTCTSSSRRPSSRRGSRPLLADPDVVAVPVAECLDPARLADAVGASR